MRIASGFFKVDNSSLTGIGVEKLLFPREDSTLSLLAFYLKTTQRILRFGRGYSFILSRGFSRTASIWRRLCDARRNIIPPDEGGPYYT
jgi:hypothetical protein